MTTNITALRSCGERIQGGLYATVDAAMTGGRPIDFFLVDPVLPWTGPQLRSPMQQPDPSGQPFYHVFLGIGKESYPTVPDFIEEGRRMGISKRLPREFDPSRLVFGKSKFLLVHPRAVPHFEIQAEFECPTQKAQKQHSAPGCIGALWPASALIPAGEKHRILPRDEKTPKDIERIRTPSVEYTVPKPFGWKGSPYDYTPGIILSFPAFHFVFINKKGSIPKEMSDRFSTSSFRLKVEPQ